MQNQFKIKLNSQHCRQLSVKWAYILKFSTLLLRIDRYIYELPKFFLKQNNLIFFITGKILLLIFAIHLGLELKFKDRGEIRLS